MQELRTRRLSAAEAKAAIDTGEPVVFRTGPIGYESRAIALPAEAWRSNVETIYNGREPIRLTHHTRIDGGLIVRLLHEATDADWQPWRYAVLEISGKAVWWVVPATPYWTRRVGEVE